MTAIAWRDEYRIGIPAVDHEHQVLITLINEILEQAQQQDRSVALADCLGELHGSIAAHFALEEKEMRLRNYAYFDDHKADHERLLDDIRDLMDEAEDHEQLQLEGFSKRLSDWFLNHFSSHDAHLHKHLRTLV